MFRLIEAIGKLDADQLNLGELIDALAIMSADLWVRFDFTWNVPGTLDSYRGFYEHIAISPLREGDPEYKYDESPQALAERLRAYVGRPMQGYKGGAYVMRLETPLWVAGWGHTSGTVITGVEKLGSNAIIRTKYVEV